MIDLKEQTEKVSLSERAYQQIKRMILSLELQPGQRIPEEKIVVQVGGSRTPVREAIRRLSAERLVNLFPRRYAEVARFDEQNVRDLAVIRVSQELLCCQLAILYATEAEVDELQYLAEACAQSALQGDAKQRIISDADFHLYLAKLSRNGYLCDQQKNLLELFHLIQISMYSGGADRYELERQHNAIVNAIRRRDLAACKKSVHEHVFAFYDIDEQVIRHIE